MKKLISQVLAVTTLTALLSSPAAFSGDANSAKQLKSRLRGAKAQISRILGSRPGNSMGRPHNFVESFEGLDVMMESDMAAATEVKEEDTQALTRLSSANIALEEAAVLAEQAEIAYSSFNFSLGNYNFVKSCSQAAIARSRVSRANILANQPPVGWLVAFSSDMGVVVDELQDLKFDVGCP